MHPKKIEPRRKKIRNIPAKTTLSSPRLCRAEWRLDSISQCSSETITGPMARQ